MTKSVKVCSKKRHRNISNDDFIALCRQKFKDEFDLSRVSFTNFKSYITIKCNTCGNIFSMRADHFLFDNKSGCCPVCRYNRQSKNRRITEQTFLERAGMIYTNGEFDYSQMCYIDTQTKIYIICKKCQKGFWRSPNSHLKGHKCPYCSHRIVEAERMISRVKEVWGDAYDYSKAKYTNAHNKIKLKCNKHGWFEQRVDHLLNGIGCPTCNHSKGERKISVFLNEHMVSFVPQYRVVRGFLPFCNRYYYIDFYIPSMNIAIEYNGEQHYRNTFFHSFGRRTFKQQVERDRFVRQYCYDNNIKLIEIPYTEIDNINNILQKELKL